MCRTMHDARRIDVCVHVLYKGGGRGSTLSRSITATPQNSHKIALIRNTCYNVAMSLESNRIKTSTTTADCKTGKIKYSSEFTGRDIVLDFDEAYDLFCVLARFLPKIPLKTIDGHLISKEAFCKKYNLTLSKSILCEVCNEIAQ